MYLTLRNLFSSSHFGFFRREKKYTILFCLTVAAYLFCYFTLPAPIEDVNSPAMERFKEAESVLGSDNPQAVIEFLQKNPTYAYLAAAFNFVFLLLFLIGLVVQARVLWKVFHKETVFEPLEEPPALWELQDVARFLILSFGFAVFLSLFSNFAILQMPEDFAETIETPLLLWNATFVDLFGMFLVFYFAIWNCGSSFEKFGLGLKNFWRNVWTGVLTYSWVLPVFILLIVILGIIVKLFDYEPPPHALIDILYAEDKRSPLLVFFSIFLACFSGPFIEEVFFRGFLYATFKKYWGARTGMVLSAAIFAAFHQSLFAFGPIFILGLVLAYIREKKASLVPSIVMHMVHNSFLLGYFFILKRGILDQMGS